MRKLVVGTMLVVLVSALGVGVANALGYINVGVNQHPTTVVHYDDEAISSGDEDGGTKARTGIKGIVTYTVRDGNGKIKEDGIIHNTVNAEGLNDAFNLITATGSGGYDGIAAIQDAAEDPSDGVDAADIELLLDGDSGTSGDQNPADGTVTTDFGTETGNGTVAVTFTATGAADIRQIVLTRATEDDTLVGGAAAIADADIFAYVDVPDISLSTNDTVTYTWTVDVD